MRWMLSWPPTLMQFSDAGLAIPVTSFEADSDGMQALVARAMAQKVAMLVRRISINLYEFVLLNLFNFIELIY